MMLPWRRHGDVTSKRDIRRLDLASHPGLDADQLSLTAPEKEESCLLWGASLSVSLSKYTLIDAKFSANEQNKLRL